MKRSDVGCAGHAHRQRRRVVRASRLELAVARHRRRRCRINDRDSDRAVADRILDLRAQRRARAERRIRGAPGRDIVVRRIAQADHQLAARIDRGVIVVAVVRRDSVAREDHAGLRAGRRGAEVGREITAEHQRTPAEPQRRLRTHAAWQRKIDGFEERAGVSRAAEPAHRAEWSSWLKKVFHQEDVRPASNINGSSLCQG